MAQRFMRFERLSQKMEHRASQIGAEIWFCKNAAPLALPHGMLAPPMINPCPSVFIGQVSSDVGQGSAI
jgi:hypothetical protein